MQHTATTIIPFLTVRDASAAGAFYKAAFNAVELERNEISEGRYSFKLGIEGAAFYVGDEEPEFGNLKPDGTAAAPVRIVMEIGNADAIFAKALENGAIAICPMTTEEDWRIGKLKDPFGHIWEIGHRL